MGSRKQEKKDAVKITCIGGGPKDGYSIDIDWEELVAGKPVIMTFPSRSRLRRAQQLEHTYVSKRSLAKNTRSIQVAYDGLRRFED